ncbi:MAG: hypothetical protein ACC742_01060 [Thermoanaerobaculales bacterium]
MKSLSQERAEFLWVLAARIAPDTVDLDTGGKSRFFGTIDEALQERTPAVRRQFGAFLGLLRWAPLVRFGGPFESLRPERQDAVLRWFEDCPIGLLRKGFWGLRVLVYMGYYGQTETWEAVGYAPNFDGRAGLHA